MADFATLQQFDPDTAARLDGGLRRWSSPPAPDLVNAMARDILDGIAVEPAFGQSLVDGYMEVIQGGTPALLARYRELLVPFAAHGPTVGRIVARTLAPVMRRGDPVFVDTFLSVVAIMRRKGSHTLVDPLDALGRLLNDGDLAAAGGFLALLAATYSRRLTFNRANHLTKHLPRAVLKLRPRARAWQMAQLTVAMRVSDRLAERLWESLLSTDLGLLTEAALKTFIDDAVQRFHKAPEAGLDFAALRTLQGRDACERLRTAVPLAEVRRALGAYASLRLGRGCAILPMSTLSARVATDDAAPLVRCVPDTIYVADVLNIYPEARTNRDLYQCLVRLECGVLEGGTYDFDMDKAADRLGCARPVPGDGDMRIDLAHWLDRYRSPALATYLFSVFETARIHRWGRHFYPGLARRAARFVADGCHRIRQAWPTHPFTPLVIWSVDPRLTPGGAGAAQPVKEATALFDRWVTPFGAVEDTAVLLDTVYPFLAALAETGAPGFPDLVFGRRIDPETPTTSSSPEQRQASRIQKILARHGVTVYRSDLIRNYRDNGNAFTPEGVQQAVGEAAQIREDSGGDAPAPSITDRWQEVVDDLLVETSPSSAAETTGLPVFSYPEWDRRQGDYRSHHVRVRIGVPVADDPALCRAVLRQRYHLVSRIRKAFELLRPQGLVLLRRWMEGDDFDYRALLDFAVDRRTGRTPSQRVYLKRLKAHRDVATLLLVDQSRSTSHPALGTRQSVMDVEKAAIVLFCEALGVLGDRFAVAGFSGSGRLGVDFFWMKTFGEVMGDGVWSRIAGMAPLRSTRMGAAIRHATASFEAMPAAVRLLIVLGDGFPNDVDYKKGYAIEDTRKAIQEAHARRIHTHGITVNIASDAGLDALYGGSAHTVISDVRELPDALWRVYANLTR